MSVVLGMLFLHTLASEVSSFAMEHGAKALNSRLPDRNADAMFQQGAITTKNTTSSVSSTTSKPEEDEKIWIPIVAVACIVFLVAMIVIGVCVVARRQRNKDGSKGSDRTTLKGTTMARHDYTELGNPEMAAGLWAAETKVMEETTAAPNKTPATKIASPEASIAAKSVVKSVVATSTKPPDTAGKSVTATSMKAPDAAGKSMKSPMASIKSAVKSSVAPSQKSTVKSFVAAASAKSTKPAASDAVSAK